MAGNLGAGNLGAGETGGTDTRARLDRLLSQIRSAGERQVGYPASQRFDYSQLYPFLQYSLNNVGDPFHESNY